MATFKLDKQWSATYSCDQIESGWLCDGRLYKDGMATEIKFEGFGDTKADAINNAHANAHKVHALFLKQNIKNG